LLFRVIAVVVQVVAVVQIVIDVAVVVQVDLRQVCLSCGCACACMPRQCIMCTDVDVWHVFVDVY